MGGPPPPHFCLSFISLFMHLFFFFFLQHVFSLPNTQDQVCCVVVARSLLIHNLLCTQGTRLQMQPNMLPP